MVLQVNWKRTASLNARHIKIVDDCIADDCIADDCLCIELNGNWLEIVAKFCYLGEIKGSRGVAFLLCYNKDQQWID